MKRRDLLAIIVDACREQGRSWSLVRPTGPHDVYECDGLRVAIPRHGEINVYTAEGDPSPA